MNGYFKPLRRQVGVLTLVLACVFAAGWVRSTIVRDDFFCVLQNGHKNLVLASAAGSIRWATYVTTYQSKQDIAWATDKVLNAHDHDLYWKGRSPKWRYGFAGFDFGAGSLDRNTRLERWVAPYWSVVIPLTLLSAYLLLTRPRAPKTSEKQG